MIAIKEFDFGNECPAFMGLYNTVYKKAVNEAYCKWKFIDNPFGRAFGFGAWVGNNLVGFVALTPYQFCVNGQLQTASQGADTMVHPNYRSKGLFTDLTRILLDEMNKKGWWFRYSAPGNMSCPGYMKKLAHSLVCVLPYQVKTWPVNWVRYKLGLLPQNNLGNLKLAGEDLHIKLIDKFTGDYDNLWNSIKPMDFICINKTAVYMNWRYIDHPVNKHIAFGCYRGDKLAGIAVCNGGNLLDIIGEQDEKIYSALIGAINRTMGNTGLVMAHTWVLGNALLAKTLNKYGWFNYNAQWRPIGFYQDQPLLVYPNKTIYAAGSVVDSSRWRFSMGDVDCM